MSLVSILSLLATSTAAVWSMSILFCSWATAPLSTLLQTIANPNTGARSPVTSHVLDTALGRPAEGVLITLQRAADSNIGVAGEGSVAVCGDSCVVQANYFSANRIQHF